MPQAVFIDKARARGGIFMKAVALLCVIVFLVSAAGGCGGGVTTATVSPAPPPPTTGTPTVPPTGTAPATVTAIAPTAAPTTTPATTTVAPTPGATPATTPAPTSPPATATATPTTTATPAPSPGTTAPPLPTAQPATGQGTLYLTDDGPTTLDPATAAEAGSGAYILNIFGGLVRLDEKMIIVPEIAERWDRSPDGKTYTFCLRQDALFHDGRRVRAADFKYSWERALNPATRSTTAGTYLNDIVGAQEMLAGSSRELTGVTVIDDSTLEVMIDAPKSYFLYKMAFPTAFVVDRANVESGAQWWQRPNGTGPFKLKQWQKDQLLVLERNAEYTGEKAKVSEVRYMLLSGSSIQLYQNGTIDVSPVGSVFMGLVTDPTNPISRELQVYPELSFFYIGFNASAPPFDDVKVRQAFSYAVDKERVAALSLMGVATTAYGILPPGMPGHDQRLAGLRFDPAKARQLIAESKYGDVSRLPPIVVTTSGFGGFISGTLGGVIEEWRRNLGVKVTVRQLDPERYVLTLRQEKDQLFENGWIADYPDPQNFLDVLFRGRAHNNTGEYGNPQVDALLDRAAVEPDENVRMGRYREAERAIVEDAATLPLFFGRSYVLVKPWVAGYVESPLGYPLLNKISVGLRPPGGLKVQ
ncbi:MAG: peptide ABC transporter substrate-binding protein [Chloroflexi bacterium]|nr:peptide ABC transporter substrate-binding protein [Chloroflexota bacterium]